MDTRGNAKANKALGMPDGGDILETTWHVYLDTMPQHIVVVDSQCVIVYCNRAWIEFGRQNGIDPGFDWRGVDYLGGIDGTDPNAESTRDGIRAVVKGDTDRFQIEYPCHGPTESRWFQMEARPLPARHGGALVSHTDISDRVLGERRAHLLSKVMDSSSQAVLITDDTERIVYVNPAFTEITGFTEAEALGQTPRILSSGKHDHDFYESMWASLNTKGFWRGEIWNRRKSGEEYPELVAINAVTDSDGYVGHYVCMFSDIEGIKDTERELRRANAELEQFAYVASHDLREPLRMVSSYMDLIRRRMGADLDSKTADYMRYASDGAVRMDCLIQDLLEFSRIGRQFSPPVRLDLSEILARVAIRFEDSLSECGGTLRIHGRFPRLVASESEIERLFQNLVENAVKYRSSERPLMIGISAKKAQSSVQLTVRDNGIGIPENQEERVFRMFQRLHHREAFGGGSGMGLAICRKIVERHGGRIWVDNGPDGVGCRFQVVLPLATEIA